jgi:O-antigen ligase
MKSVFEPLRLWFSVAAFMFVVITTSISYGSFVLTALHAILGVSLAFVWLIPKGGSIPGSGKIALLIALFATAWVALQLVPLPPQVWQSMTGRGSVTDSFVAFGVLEPWLPLSLSPASTGQALMSIAPALGLFFCGLRLSHDKRLVFLLAIVMAAVLNVLFGLGIRYAAPAPESALGFFAKSGFLSGFFLNRNFFAALLYLSIPMLVALLLHLVARGRLNKLSALVLGIIYLALLLVGLAASASRTGILLAMGALLLSPFLARGLWAAVGSHTVSRLALIGMVVGFVVIGQFGLVAISRLAQIDAVNEQRLTMYTITARAIGQYFPWGSGFGSFVPVYQRYERPADMVGNAYINHAHNDWLELVLEGGLPAAILLVVFLLWVIAATWSIWRRPMTRSADLAPRAATLAVWLLMIHSVVDYPLRAPALLAVFSLCLGFMSASPAPVKVNNPSSRPQAPLTPRPIPAREGRSLWPPSNRTDRREPDQPS